MSAKAIKILYLACLCSVFQSGWPAFLSADEPREASQSSKPTITASISDPCSCEATSNALPCICELKATWNDDNQSRSENDTHVNESPIVEQSVNDERIGKVTLAQAQSDVSTFDDGVTWSISDASDPMTLGVQDPGVGFPVTGSNESGSSDTPTIMPRDASDPQTWGAQDPGNGFLIGRTDEGQLSISAYALLRYMNQMGDKSFIDHLGREQPVDLRHDIYSHRILVYLKGWLMDPKFLYNIAFWTVNTTDQDALFGNFGYQFCEQFNLYGGINGTPGTRSMQGSHPYWLGHDRVMADEFFRPFFSQGIWANGELLPGLWYNTMIGNTSSTLGVTASAIDREFTYGGSMWWMPTTHEFGPRGAFGDWEIHEQLATRFGFSTAYSPEERYSEIVESPDNTTLKLADSLNLFATGSLAPNVTITNADYKILSLDAGMKYMGFFLQTEFYQRWLEDFRADGALPVDQIRDWGFYVQGSIYLIPRTLELYAATSQIYGDKDAGFDDSSEYLIGANYYPWDSRNYRLNLQVMDVNDSPVNSTFGYYTGGQNGTTVSTAVSVLF